MNKDEFGKMLKALREQHNMTQAKLAEMLHVTTASVSKWETGKNLPTDDIQDKICQLFNLSHNELHNPAFVLSRFDRKVEIISEQQTATPTKEKRSTTNKKFLFWAIVSFLINTVIVGVLFFFYIQDTTKSFSVYYVGARYYLDEYSGEEIYECSYVYIGTYTPKNSSSFSERARQQWLEDKNVRQDINTLKLSFYKNEQDARSWKPTKKWVYLFR